MTLDAKHVDRFKQKANAMTASKLLLYIAIFFNVILQVFLLWITAQCFASNKATVNQMAQLEFALQGIKGKLKEIIVDKERISSKVPSGDHCLCHGKLRRETLQEHNKRLNKRFSNDQPSKNKVEEVVSPRDKKDDEKLVSNTGKRSPLQSVKGKTKSKKNRKRSKSAKVVYTNWGKNTCRDTDFRVYEGQVAGASSNYANYGGGTNYICMKGNPSYSISPYSSNYDRVSLYPVRFGRVSTVLTRTRYDKQSLDHFGVSCAVCLTNDPVVMMPGTKYCPVKWMKHYLGYLMAQAQNSSASEFICVDTKSIRRPNTKSSSPGRPVLSLVQYNCPDSSCGEYQHHSNEPIPCVVCSKTF